MTTGPRTHSALQRSRREFGLRLRALRRDAGLTGRALAAATGQHHTRVSKIENGVQQPTPVAVRAWAAACGADAEVPGLLTALRAIESAYIDLRRESRAGMRQVIGQHTPERYARTRRIRVYEHRVVPGIFQTADYCAAMLAFWFRFLDAPHDLDAAVAVRMERQHILYRPDRQIECVLEEQALRTWLGTAEVQLGQLDRLLAVLSLPTVTLGIVPLLTPRTSGSQVSFWIFDDELVTLETPSAGIGVEDPEEIGAYARTFDLLRADAVYGPAARRLVVAAIEDTARRVERAPED
jgi:transcriptional regulator with XRE-family HTH domain